MEEKSSKLVTTKFIPFEGSNREIEEAEQTRNPKFSKQSVSTASNGSQQKSRLSETADETNGKPESCLSGYIGAVYWNPDTQQIIIAHRGTEPEDGSTILGTLFTDVKGIFFNQHAYQIDSAVTFTERIISALKEINQKNKHEGKEEPYIQLF